MLRNSLCRRLAAKWNGRGVLRMKSVVIFILGFLSCYIILSLTWNCNILYWNSKESAAPAGGQISLSNTEEGPLLVILVFSSVINYDRRQAIRETWAKDLTIIFPDVRFFFVISGSGLSDENKEQIDSEQKSFSDLLIFHNLEDSFHTLTTKTLLSLSWLSGHSLKLGPLGSSSIPKAFQSFSYALKCDDDSFVRVKEIVEELKSNTNLKHVALYWGFFDGRAHVKRSGKYKELGWNICDTYLPYALGGGYVLAEALVAFIGRNADVWRRFQSEDTSVGAWLAAYDGIHRVHDPRFDTEYLSRGCHQSYLITHKHTAENIRAIHRQLQLGGQLCHKEYRTRLSYKYDWSVLPSKCCSRNNPNIP